MSALSATDRTPKLAPKTVRHAYTLAASILRTPTTTAASLPCRCPSASGGGGACFPKFRGRSSTTSPREQVITLAETEPIAPRFTALVFLAVYGAAGWGELAGLRVNRLRLLERKVDIIETTSGEPKWGSAGTVTIPSPIAEALAAHLKRFPPGEDGLVFTSPEGKPLSYPDFYRRVWLPAVGTADLPHAFAAKRRRRGPDDPSCRWCGASEGAPVHRDGQLRIHDLRHSGVAAAIEAGAHPKQIQELARHRSVTMTLGVYGHLFPNLHDELADRLGDRFALAVSGHRAGPLRDRRGTGVVVALPLSED